MKTLYSGLLSVDYRQFYITLNSDEEIDMDPDASFKGQKNGLCGSQLNNMIFFVPGIQSGTISLDIELHSAAPEVDEYFDEIVEVSFKRGSLPLSLCEWGWEEEHDLMIPEGTYRLRYLIAGMELEHSEEAMEEDEDIWENPVPGQRYLVQLWPGDIEADVIIKQTSESAQYWHGERGDRHKAA